MVFQSKKTFILVLIVMILSLTAMMLVIFSHPDPKPSGKPAPPPITEAEIQKQFSAFVNESGNETNSIDILDSEGKAVPLETVSRSLGFQIYPSLKDLCFPNSYQFFSCKDENGEKDYGLRLNIDSDEENITALMKLWENQLLSDLHAVLFPGVTFSPSLLEQTMAFQDGLARYAPINLPDNMEGSINYTVVDETVFLSSSWDCLAKGGDFLYDP